MIFKNQTSKDIMLKIHEQVFMILNGEHLKVEFNDNEFDAEITYIQNKLPNFWNPGFHMFFRSICSIRATSETVVIINECVKCIKSGYRGLSIYQYEHALCIENGELIKQSVTLDKSLKNSWKLSLRTIVLIAEYIVTTLLLVSLFIALIVSDILMIYKVFVAVALIVCIWEMICIIRFTPKFGKLLVSYLR